MSEWAGSLFTRLVAAYVILRYADGDIETHVRESFIRPAPQALKAQQKLLEEKKRNRELAMEAEEVSKAVWNKGRYRQ